MANIIIAKQRGSGGKNINKSLLDLIKNTWDFSWTFLSRQKTINKSTQVIDLKVNN